MKLRLFLLAAVCLAQVPRPIGVGGGGGGGGGGYSIIQDEGANLPSRSALNFIGSGVTCTDATTRTDCTISAGGGGAGMVYSLGDFQLTRSGASNETSNIGSSCSASTPCAIRIGSAVKVYTSGASVTLSGTASSGTLYWYFDPSTSRLKAGHNTAATATCNANCDVVTSVSNFPADSLPIAAHTFTANAFDAVTASMDMRSMISREAILAGSGISATFNGATGQITLATDNTVMQVSQAQAGLHRSCVTSGTSAAYTCSLTPSLLGYTDRMIIAARFHTPSSASPTINVDGLGARSILKSNGTSDPVAIAAGELRASTYVLVFDAALNAFVTDIGGAAAGGGGLPDPGSNGYVVRTAGNTVASRTFQAGTSISLTNADGVAGNTTISYSPFDRASLVLVDDFVGRSRIDVDGSVGQLLWTYVSYGGGTCAITRTTEANHPGVIQASLSGTPASGHECSINMLYAGTTWFPNLGSGGAFSSWDVQAIVKTGSAITDTAYVIGFSQISSSFINATQAGIVVRYSTANRTCTNGTNSTTQWVYETHDGANNTCVASGVTVAADTWYRIRIFSTTAGTIQFEINGANSGSISTNVPTVNMSPRMDVTTWTAAARALGVDRWAMLMTGLSR